MKNVNGTVRASMNKKHKLKQMRVYQVKGLDKRTFFFVQQ